MTPAVVAPPAFKYSNRVILKAIVERGDSGTGLIGLRVVVGGWVKSSKEFRKEVPAATPPATDHGAAAAGDAGSKDVTCTEILQSRIPFIRSIIRAFSGSSYPVREKLEPVAPMPPRPSISILQVNDGSCTESLQVLSSEDLTGSFFFFFFFCFHEHVVVVSTENPFEILFTPAYEKKL